MPGVLPLCRSLRDDGKRVDRLGEDPQFRISAKPCDNCVKWGYNRRETESRHAIGVRHGREGMFKACGNSSITTTD
jgi:hypothetical protein